MAEDFTPVKLTLAQEQRQREKRWKQKLAKLQLTEKIFKHHALAPLYHPRLIDPSPLWREFVRQKQAFSFAATFKEVRM
ncbi:DNA-directed primase/polymerase protein-like [Ptychodera flava]|uniref:DNA-directed primase/polymerase protein-like n=1 Tax=Ptychodera flava TaxID=63121 RepID=UPI00396A0195